MTLPAQGRSRILRARSLGGVLPFAAAGVGLAGAIVWWSLLPALAPTAPNIVIDLQPKSPAATIAYVQQELAASAKAAETTPPDPAVLDRLRGMLKATLASQPLDARIYSLLGLIAQREGDAARTTALMQTAASLSSHETIAMNWLMLERFSAKDYPGVIGYVDLMLTNGYPLLQFVLPVLARMAETADAAPTVESFLAAKPPWRSSFFYFINDAVTDPRTPLRLLLSLKDTSDPPTREEVRFYLLFAMQHHLVDLAYEAWLQFLSPERLESVGNIFDGDFRQPIADTPFDWHIASGVNYAAGIAPRPDRANDMALNVEFGDGRVEFQDISQIILLKPGAYRFSGTYMGSVIGRRGLQWTVRCETSETAVGESPMVLGRFPQWQTFDVPLTVPQDCPVQTLRLVFTARSASEQLVGGSIWFDDLAIARDETAPPPETPVPPPVAAPAAPVSVALPPPANVPASVPARRTHSPAASSESTGTGRRRSTR